MSRLILTEQASNAATPAASKVAIFVDNSTTPQIKMVNDAGGVVTIADANNALAFTNKTTTFAAGTTSVAAMKMTGGATLATAAAGAVEYDGTVFYTTPVASARGLSHSTMFSIVPAGDFALQTGAGVQSAFPTTGDVWTLQASTAYFFDGIYYITKTTGSITTALAFALGGGASVTSINYFVEAFNGAADTTVSGATASAVNLTWVDQVASTVINAAATTALAIKFQGIIRMNAGGTVTPQINFSGTATVPVMKTNSYIRFTPLGSNTVNLLGNVA